MVDNDSSDLKTRAILSDVASLPGVIVVYDHEELFNQERLANQGIWHGLDLGRKIDWIISLDADEFLIAYPSLSNLLSNLEDANEHYVSISQLNNIADNVNLEFGIEPLYLASSHFYTPTIERPWQQDGYFSKALCRVHPGMRVSVGNHYFHHEILRQAYPSAPYSPTRVPLNQAVLLHFEMRDAGELLLEKWESLGLRHVVPDADVSAPWWEKRDRMLELYHHYKEKPHLLRKYLVEERKTLWGNHIDSDKIVKLSDLQQSLKSLIP